MRVCAHREFRLPCRTSYFSATAVLGRHRVLARQLFRSNMSFPQQLSALDETMTECFTALANAEGGGLIVSWPHGARPEALLVGAALVSKNGQHVVVVPPRVEGKITVEDDAVVTDVSRAEADDMMAMVAMHALSRPGDLINPSLKDRQTGNWVVLRKAEPGIDGAAIHLVAGDVIVESISIAEMFERIGFSFRRWVPEGGVQREPLDLEDFNHATSDWGIQGGSDQDLA